MQAAVLAPTPHQLPRTRTVNSSRTHQDVGDNCSLAIEWVFAPATSGIALVHTLIMGKAGGEGAMWQSCATKECQACMCGTAMTHHGTLLHAPRVEWPRHGLAVYAGRGVWTVQEGGGGDGALRHVFELVPCADLRGAAAAAALVHKVLPRLGDVVVQRNPLDRRRRHHEARHGVPEEAVLVRPRLAAVQPHGSLRACGGRGAVHDAVVEVVHRPQRLVDRPHVVPAACKQTLVGSTLLVIANCTMVGPDSNT